tara:strand:+ start:119 stop:1102 length:984 start_codon:yes stop_codon:yes gene_type:complete
MVKNRNIYCILTGGIGNQLFQYSFAKYVSTIQNRNLYFISKNFFIFNSISGRNKIFKKKNNLKAFGNKISLLSLLGIKTKNCSFFFNILYFIIPTLKKIKIIKSDSIYFFNYVLFIEKNKGFDKNIFRKVLASENKNIILYGYWQSKKYFPENLKSIFPTFSPYMYLQKKFKNILDIIKEKNSVGICIRIYEDLPGNKINNNFNTTVMGGIPNINYYKKAIKILKLELKEPTFFIFSSRNFTFLKELNLSNSDYFINNDNGFSGTVDNLLLMSRCKHLVISNSSYYWWAAFIGSKHNKELKVYRPYNKETEVSKIEYFPKDWIKFEY